MKHISELLPEAMAEIEKDMNTTKYKGVKGLYSLEVRTDGEKIEEVRSENESFVNDKYLKLKKEYPRACFFRNFIPHDE